MRVIDIHTHGIAGYDTKGATPEDILRIAEIQGSYGIDAIIPTVYSASIDQMRTDIAAVKKAMELHAIRAKEREEGSYKTGIGIPARILGIHLEGPFLNPTRAGALDKNSFIPARIFSWEKLVEDFGDVIKIITIAPELDGAANLIKTISNAGMIVSMGHSDATYAEAEEGFNAGAKGITHMFNAMRGIHHHEPGIAGFGLVNPHVYTEVIADPFHLHRRMIELIFKVKNPEKIIIVSDSVKTTKMDTVKGGIIDPMGKLMGGSMTITESVQYLIDLGFSNRIVEQCISSNPGEYLK